jgi:DNA-binding transcriptional MerR regulator
MSKPEDPAPSREPTYSLGAVARLTGLSPHVLRAWERRYGAVRPLRTPGGTRRYLEADVARLHKLRAAVLNGHPIGEVASLPEEELERRVGLAPLGAPRPLLAPILEAVEVLDAGESERLLGCQLSALGAARFVRLVASPLLGQIGERWESGRLCVAAEHLASSILRNLLGGLLHTPGAAAKAPPILFTPPPGERHELGALMAAVTAIDSGGNPIFLGPDLPVEEVARAAHSLAAAAVGVGVCRRNGSEHADAIRGLRAALRDGVEIWVGGPGSDQLELSPGTSHVAHAGELERKVSLLGLRGSMP